MNNDPIILGKVKKGKTGKPLLVLIVFLLLGSIILFLPTIIEYFGDYNIIDLIKNGQIVEFFTNHDSFFEETVPNHLNTTTGEIKYQNSNVLINSKAIISDDNLTLSNFKLDTDSITFTIATANPIDFDKRNYYLILNQDDSEVGVIKIVGKIDGESTYKMNFQKKLNSVINISGTLKELKENEYPALVLSSDESGISSLICTLDNREIEYTFSLNKLVMIKDSFVYNKTNYEINQYNAIYKDLSNKTNIINKNKGSANLTENDNELNFIAYLELENMDISELNDNNYYVFNTTSSKINYEMLAKGFDCR